MKQSDKKLQLKRHKQCYVCKALGLKHADFTGYATNEINFDHWMPKGLVGNAQDKLLANQLPIHAHPEGKSYFDTDFETASTRNCHKGKGNRFPSGQEWVEAVKIWQAALHTRFADELFPKRKISDSGQRVTVKWDRKKQLANFRGDEYPVTLQKVRQGEASFEWRSFFTLVPPHILWTDNEVQTRPADSHRVANLALHLRRFPLLTPILCRVAGDRLKVFDGNHRLCAFLLARPKDDVPVIIFDGPTPQLFLEVVAIAHDDLTQQKYQYTEKALKYGALNEGELEEAERKYGNSASEKLAYQGHQLKDVKLRLVGRLSESLESEGHWRRRWLDAGLTDKSWNDFIDMYAKLEPEAEPFSSETYLRESELKNLAFLCEVIDEELFDALDRIPEAKASLKTKWWKMAHKRLVTKAAQVIRDSLGLSTTPRHPAYTKEWNEHIKNQIRQGMKRWTNSPAWREKTTANNEPDVAAHLDRFDFSENYLMG